MINTWLEKTFEKLKQKIASLQSGFNTNYSKGLGFEIEVLTLLYKSEIPIYINTPLYNKSNIYWNVRVDKYNQIDIAIPTKYGTIIIECKNWEKNWTYSNPNKLFSQIENSSHALETLIKTSHEAINLRSKKIIVFPDKFDNITTHNIEYLTNIISNDCLDSSKIHRNYLHICTISQLLNTLEFIKFSPTCTDNCFNIINNTISSHQSFNLND